MPEIPEASPKTVSEAAQHVMKILDAQAIAAIQSMEKGDFGVKAHFFLGVDIRNALVYQNYNLQLLKIDCNKVRYGDTSSEHAYMFIHEDDISHSILEQIWALAQNAEGCVTGSGG